jgi:hypothetical protein
MNSTDKDLAMGKLVSEMLQHCCEYLYATGGLSQNDAQTQAKIKAAAIQNDILRETVEKKKDEIQQKIEAGGARSSNPDAELPLIEEAEIVKDPVKEQEAEDLFKEFGGSKKTNDSDDESVEDLLAQLSKTQGPGDALLGFGPGTPNGVIAKGPDGLDDDE